ncbi:MAG: hypothetical protein M1836_005084 [Candelina mexicana]|nr:MAG: hypothetical protein M1836_005084 [Candelina mexicana]
MFAKVATASSQSPSNPQQPGRIASVKAPRVLQANEGDLPGGSGSNADPAGDSIQPSPQFQSSEKPLSQSSERLNEETFSYQQPAWGNKLQKPTPAVVVQGHTVTEKRSAAPAPTPLTSDEPAMTGLMTILPVRTDTSAAASPILVSGQTASIYSNGAVVIGGRTIASSTSAVAVMGTPVLDYTVAQWPSNNNLRNPRFPWWRSIYSRFARIQPSWREYYSRWRTYHYRLDCGQFGICGASHWFAGQTAGEDTDASTGQGVGAAILSGLGPVGGDGGPSKTRMEVFEGRAALDVHVSTGLRTIMVTVAICGFLNL